MAAAPSGKARPAGAERLAVRPDCAGAARCFATIGAALAAAGRIAPDRWVEIGVAAGDYREKITIARPRTRLAGAGAGRTRIRFAAVAEHARAYHRDGWGTPGSATLTIAAPDVALSGLTVANDFDFRANDALPPGDPARIANAQAVALLLDTSSDRVSIVDAALLGHQDTLFAHGGRALVRRSLIAGSIDFVFGDGMLWIEDSELRSRARAKPGPEGTIDSFILAPSTPRRQGIGIVFHRSRLTREPGVPDGSVALGRPWHPTRSFADGRYADPDAIGHAVLLDCRMDAHIAPQGWTSMAGTARDGSKTALFAPQDARFFESGSRGPGARRTAIGLRWREERGLAALRAAFLAGWNGRWR